MIDLAPANRLAASIRETPQKIVPYLTAGYPDMATFVGHLENLARMVPAVEVGLPFSDPMADGATIQESSRLSLQGGTTIENTLEALRAASVETPLIVMSYLNPLIAFGLDALMERFGAVGVCGLVVPDLPVEEASELTAAANARGIGLAQMVTPITSNDRLEELCQASQGFVYAVTMTGTTGGSADGGEGVSRYLDRVSDAARVPVLAGFGVRNVSQVRALLPHCDGVIVGSAVVESIAAGRDPVSLIKDLTS